MDIRFRCFSECGLRSRNEDYVVSLSQPDEGRFLAVLCDGMGGYGNGDKASALVAEGLCDYWISHPAEPDSIAKITAACDAVFLAFNDASEGSGEMGSTMTLVSIEGRKAHFAHCGDSRIYLVRDGEIFRRTIDHSGVTPEGWPVVTRAFFTGEEIYRPDVVEIELRSGDRILMCSDGVWGNGKEKLLEKELCKPGFTLDSIRAIAAYRPHDNFSAALISVE